MVWQMFNDFQLMFGSVHRLLHRFLVEWWVNCWLSCDRCLNDVWVICYWFSTDVVNLCLIDCWLIADNLDWFLIGFWFMFDWFLTFVWPIGDWVSDQLLIDCWPHVWPTCWQIVDWLLTWFDSFVIGFLFIVDRCLIRLWLNVYLCLTDAWLVFDWV